MALRNTVQSKIFVTIIMVMSLLMLTGSAFADGTMTPASQEAEAKNLTPAAGKSLVYFFYGRSSCRGDLELSLDGASTFLNKDMFVLWEVPAGEHRLEVVIPARGTGKGLTPITADLTVSSEAGGISYYRLISEGDAGDDDYRLVPISTSAGRKHVADKSLVSWYQDGTLVYQNEQLLASAE